MRPGLTSPAEKCHPVNSRPTGSVIGKKEAGEEMNKKFYRTGWGAPVLLALLLLAALVARVPAVYGELSDHPGRVVYFGAGGQESVSGSLHALEFAGDLYLVDVGSFIGGEGRNYPWPAELDPAALRGVFITHAHTDHLGRLPLLLQEGYRGPIYMSRITYAIARLTLPANLEYADLGPERFYYSRHNQGRDRIPVHLEGSEGAAAAVQPANRVYFSASRPELSARGYYLARPVREKLAADLLERLAEQVVIVDPGQELELASAGLRASFIATSHIPGSVMVRFDYQGFTVLFSGDVGGDSSPLLPANPRLEQPLDVLFLEGTYAYGQRADLARERERFRREVAELVTAGKRVVIPAFVLDRSQQVMFEISRAIGEGRLPPAQTIRVCSPSAHQLLRLYADFAADYRSDRTLAAYFSPAMAGADFLPPGYVPRCSGDRPANPLGLEPGEIGIMSSGMADYAAARQALLDYLEDPQTVFYFVGYQAPGSLGGRLTATPPPASLRIGDQQRRVRAEIRQTAAFASHADPAEMLRIFAGTRPERIFLIHLDKDRGPGLAARYRQELGAEIIIPRPGQRYRLR